MDFRNPSIPFFIKFTPNLSTSILDFGSLHHILTLTDIELFLKVKTYTCVFRVKHLVYTK
jgi:hypothetical protein